jgi:hypothetical protein
MLVSTTTLIERRYVLHEVRPLLVGWTSEDAGGLRASTPAIAADPFEFGDFSVRSTAFRLAAPYRVGKCVAQVS